MNYIYLTAQIINQPRYFYINRNKYFYSVLSILNEKRDIFNTICAYGKVDNKLILEDLFCKKDFVFVEGFIYQRYYSINIADLTNKNRSQIFYIKINKIQSY